MTGMGVGAFLSLQRLSEHFPETESVSVRHTLHGWQYFPGVPAGMILVLPQPPVMHLVAQKFFALQSQCPLQSPDVTGGVAGHTVQLLVTDARGDLHVWHGWQNCPMVSALSSPFVPHRPVKHLLAQ